MTRLSSAAPWQQAPATVLVGIANPTTLPPLMSLARRITRADGARILATHIVTVPQQMALSSMRSSPQVASATGLLREAIDVGSANGDSVDGIVEISRDVPVGLAAAASKHDADLVLLGWSDLGTKPASDEESRFDKLMHRVADAVPCHLAVAKFRQTALDRVLVPVAPSRHLPLVASMVRRLAAAGCTITFLHVVPAESAVAKARDLVMSLLERHEISEAGPIETVVAEDTAAAVLAHAADHDLAVIGAATKAAVAEALFGSTAERIAADAPCSVVVARAGS